MLCVGVVERGIEGGGEDIGAEGVVDNWPEVVYGVRSSTSGKSTRHELRPA